MADVADAADAAHVVDTAAEDLSIVLQVAPGVLPPLRSSLALTHGVSKRGVVGTVSNNTPAHSVDLAAQKKFTMNQGNRFLLIYTPTCYVMCHFHLLK